MKWIAIQRRYSHNLRIKNQNCHHIDNIMKVDWNRLSAVNKSECQLANWSNRIRMSAGLTSLSLCSRCKASNRDQYITIEIATRADMVTVSSRWMMCRAVSNIIMIRMDLIITIPRTSVSQIKVMANSPTETPRNHTWATPSSPPISSRTSQTTTSSRTTWYPTRKNQLSPTATKTTLRCSIKRCTSKAITTCNSTKTTKRAITKISIKRDIQTVKRRLQEHLKEICSQTGGASERLQRFKAKTDK